MDSIAYPEKKVYIYLKNRYLSYRYIDKEKKEKTTLYQQTTIRPFTCVRKNCMGCYIDIYYSLNSVS